MIADPLLEEKYPVNGFCQALAVAEMCLQEEADTRPLMGDVVTALEFLTRPKDSDEIVAESQTDSSLHVKPLKQGSSKRDHDL